MRKSVEIPQSQFLDNVVDMPGVLSGADVRTPVEIPQVPFLDKLFMPVVVSGADESSWKLECLTYFCDV